MKKFSIKKLYYMKKVLFYKEAESPLAFGDVGKRVSTNIEWSVHFNPRHIFDRRFGDVFYFRCSVGCISCASRNPFSCIFEALEHESIGMAKYTELKKRSKKKRIMDKFIREVKKSVEVAI